MSNDSFLKIMLTNLKQLSYKNYAAPQENHDEKRCEIKGGGQEMTVMED